MGDVDDVIDRFLAREERSIDPFDGYSNLIGLEIDLSQRPCFRNQVSERLRIVQWHRTYINFLPARCNHLAAIAVFAFAYANARWKDDIRKLFFLLGCSTNGHWLVKKKPSLIDCQLSVFDMVFES